MKVRTWFQPPIDLGEVNCYPSVTVPDQTMSLRQILERYARGLPVSGVLKTPIYDHENDLPNPATLDFAERADLSEFLANEVNRMRLALSTQQTLPLPSDNPSGKTLNPKQPAAAPPEEQNNN
jgi:hypothetical protein